MGTQTVNREEILAREVDELSIKQTGRRFWRQLIAEHGVSLRAWYLQDIPRLIRDNRLPIGVASLITLVAFGFGCWLAGQYLLPPQLIGPMQLRAGFSRTLPPSSFSILPSLTTGILGFLTVFVIPHGIFEIPATILATGFALRVGASIMNSRRGDSARDGGFLGALADWVKVFVLVVVPLLLIAAWIEATITPQIASQLIGGG